MARSILLVAVAACAALATMLTGCLETSVKPIGSTIMTAGQAERARAAREGDAEPVDRVAEAERELEADPTEPRWHFELGRIYESRGELELAEIRYRSGSKLITRRGVYTGPHLYLGRVLVKRGLLREAIYELRRVLSIPPPTEQGYYMNSHYMQSHYLVGVAQYRLNDHQAALESFKRYLHLGGDRRFVVSYFPELMAEGRRPQPEQ